MLRSRCPAEVDLRDDLTFDASSFVRGPLITPARARLVLLAALVTALISAGVCSLAILAHAPVPAVPLVVAICIGCPLFAAWDVPVALASLRADRAERHRGQALTSLRRSLERLPETDHPLGL